MPTEQTGTKTQDNGEGTNELTLYTWNIQDGGGKKRFTHVQAAHNKIVKNYNPDIIVINEITNTQGTISQLTTTHQYCLLITHLRMRIWVKHISCVSEITIHPPEGLEFTYKTQCKNRIRIWAAHVPWNGSGKSKKKKKQRDSDKCSIIGSRVIPNCKNDIVAIGDFNLDAIDDFNLDATGLRQNSDFRHLTIPTPATSYSVNYRNWVDNDPEDPLAELVSKQMEAPYNTWFNNGHEKSLDYFISNIEAKFAVHNIEVKRPKGGRASDHNAIVVTLDFNKSNSNNGQ